MSRKAFFYQPALILGFGHMGKIHAQHLEARGIRTLHADGPEECLSALRNDLSGVMVLIATPASTHYFYAKLALEKGADVFVEKPLATSLVEAQNLVQLAAEKKSLLFVGHSESYNPEFGKFVERLRAKNHAAELFSLDFIRHGTPTDRSLDVSVAWDLGVHDYALWFDLKKALPEIHWQKVTVRFDERRGMPERRREIRAKFISGKAFVEELCDLTTPTEGSDVITLEHEDFFWLRNLKNESLEGANALLERAVFAVRTAEFYSSPNNPK